MSHIVLSGGGLKGLAIIGFMKALKEYNMKPQAISGASIGAIIGTMMSIGYTYQELYEFIEYFNYDEVCDFEISDFMEENSERILVDDLFVDDMDNLDTMFNDFMGVGNSKEIEVTP